MNHDRYIRSMVEADMEQGIRDVVRNRGRVFHIRDSRGAPETKDLPDLIVICPPTIAILELKRWNGRHTAGQAEVDELLRRCDRLIAGTVRPVKTADAFGYDEILNQLGRAE